MGTESNSYAQKTIGGETTKREMGKNPSPEGKIQSLEKSMGSLQQRTNPKNQEVKYLMVTGSQSIC